MFAGTNSFTYDHVFGGEGVPEDSLYGNCVEPLVQGLFKGYNATVFAYGQTGSGKHIDEERQLIVSIQSHVNGGITHHMLALIMHLLHGLRLRLNSRIAGQSMGPPLAMVIRWLNLLGCATGKTYTMGSAFAPGGCARGVIPKVMDTIFSRIESAEDTAITVRVGFVEIHTVSTQSHRFSQSLDST